VLGQCGLPGIDPNDDEEIADSAVFSTELSFWRGHWANGLKSPNRCVDHRLGASFQ
jgi:hypothetical protein